jgi:putative hemolysin
VGVRLVLIAVLVLINAAMAGSEIALLSLREGQLRRLEARGRSGRALARLARDPNNFLATIQVGITLSGFLASATAAVALAEPLEEPLSFLGGAAGPAAIVVVTLVLTYVTLVLGELAPKRVAMQRAERWGLIAARPLALLSTLTKPAVWLLSVSTNVVVRLLGGDPSRQREDVTEEELRDLVATQPTFSHDQRTIISGALEVGDRTIRTVLVPRKRVVSVDASDTVTEARQRLVETGHSRAPVVRDDLDDAIGVIHLRDLIDAEGLVERYARPALVLPESARVIDSLRRFQTEREQLALVVNEYGGIEGIVTVEDLVEEIVGEIYDETDRDLQQVERRPDGSVGLPGSFPMHDLIDLDVVLPEGDYATVAGLVLDRLGHIPEAPGDVAIVDGWRLEVEGIEGRTITRIALSRVSDDLDGDGDG